MTNISKTICIFAENTFFQYLTTLDDMKWLYVVLCLWAGVSGMGAARGWNDIFRPLDDTIRLRSYFSQQKERRIAHWVKALHATDDVRRKLLITNKIYG